MTSYDDAVTEQVVKTICPKCSSPDAFYVNRIYDNGVGDFGFSCKSCKHTWGFAETK